MDDKANVKPIGSSRPNKPKKELRKTAGLTLEANDLTSLHKPNSRIILPADFKQRIKTLQTCFQGTSSSTCVCFRPARSPGCFGHLGSSVKLCSRFAEIDRKLLERSKLVLIKDCLQRLQHSLEFIDELEKNLDLYVTMHKVLLQSSQSKCFSWKTFPLKKEKFHEMCQSARIHIGHWSTLRPKIISDLHLRTQLPDLMRTLRTVQLRFFQNTERICVLAGKLLLRAVEICHHLTWKIPQEALKLLAYSIDDYNDLLEFSYSSQSECEAIFSLYSLGSRLVAMLRERLTPHFNLCYRHSSTCPISLTKLLNSVAKERSRIFCTEVISCLNQNSELQKRLKYGFRYVFDWEEFVLINESGNERNSRQTNSRNGNLKVLTGTQIPVLRIEPDSLLSFENEEKLFVDQLVACLATCRTLLPLGHSSHSGSANRQTVHKLVPSYPVPVEEVPKSVPLLPYEKFDAPHHGTDFGHSILKHRQSENSPKLCKRVQWSLTLGTAQKEQFCLNYMMAVWSNVALKLCCMLGELSWNQKCTGNLTSFPLLSNTVTVMVVQLLKALKNSGSLPIPGSQSLQLVARHLHCMVAVAFWDAEFCHLLGVTLSDKCKPTCEIVDGQPSTKTVQSCLLLLDPLHSVFESATQLKCLSESYEPHSSQTNLSSETFASVVPSITRLHTLLSFCLYWFDTKLRQFLSAWTLEPLLLLIQWELPFLLDSMNKILALVHPLCTSEMHILGSTVALQDLWNDTQQKALALETLSRKSMSMFESDLRKMSTEYFRETMPQGKLWRKSRHSGAPFRPSPYAEHSVVQILEPVVASVAELSYDIQLSIMTLALTTMMEAWSDHILKEEVIFSFYGGQQIQLDFNHVKAWISSEGSGLPSGIQSHLLGLDVFKHLDGAVHLLMLQPRKKKQSANELDVELESNSSTVSSSSVISSLSGVDMEGYDLEVLGDTSIPNRQQWLDLRLRGGGKSKKGLMPFCLRTQET